MSVIAEVKTEKFSVYFYRNGRGLPGGVLFHKTEPDAARDINFDLRGNIEMELVDGRLIFPSLRDVEPEIYEQDGASYVFFSNLPWIDADENVVPGFNISLRHEFQPGGCLFTTAVFHGENSLPPPVKKFIVSTCFDFSTFDDTAWNVIPRPTFNASKNIQTFVPEKFLPKGEQRYYGGTILPLAGFNASCRSGSSLYAEAFCEGGNSLSGDIADSATEITWNENGPQINWIFQNKPTKETRRPLQWRNQWGWSVVPAPVKRNLPPQAAYQFIDNYTHYPTDEALAAMVAAQCSLLIIHSNWRRDAQDDGMPYNTKRLREIIAFAHKNNIRVALYVRGNEKEIRESAANWFDRYLQKNYDGLYMDYGGPLGRIETPSENFPGALVEFRKHYFTLKQLRERIGPDGVFISHTGAFFSGVGINFVDFYISGEAERGMLLRGRKEYEYFTMSAAAVGSLWSAAFPEYSSQQIVPLLAASGNFPHNPLGLQFKCSSLAHPPVPGVNDANFRPLWKIWSLFRNEKNIKVFNDYNSSGVFSSSSADPGHYLMISNDNQRALLVISNFSGKPINANTQVDWDKTGFMPADKSCWRLTPNTVSPGLPESCSGKILSSDFSEFPVEGFFFSAEKPDWTEYSGEYCPPGKSARAWLRKVENQKMLRNDNTPRKKLYATIHIDNSIVTSLEDSNFFDLYDSRLNLVEFMDDGTVKVLGGIGRTGFYPDAETPHDDCIMPGDSSPALPLHEISGPGRHKLGIQTIHFGEPFYSFTAVALSEDCSGKDARVIEFYNDIEPDRSLVTWSVTFV